MLQMQVEEHQRKELEEEVEQRQEEVEVGERDHWREVEEEGELLERVLQEVLELDFVRGELEQLMNYFQTYLLPHSLSVSEGRGERVGVS